MTRIFIKYIDTRSSEQPLSFPRLTLPSVGKVLASSADSRIIDKLPASPEKVKSFSIENCYNKISGGLPAQYELILCLRINDIVMFSNNS